jgi:hypothetical protein
VIFITINMCSWPTPEICAAMAEGEVGDPTVQALKYAAPFDSVSVCFSKASACRSVQVAGRWLLSGQPPFNTPQIFNTIDAGTGLTSTVAALPPEEPSPEFNVSWSGTDSAKGSAIASFTIYVSDNSGPSRPG